MWFLVTCLASVGLAVPAWAAPGDTAFDQATGALKVDYGTYLSKHDIVYNRPNTNPIQGLTVGNGRTGAMAWNENGLTMQVSGVDLSQQSTYAAGLATSSPPRPWTPGTRLPAEAVAVRRDADHQVRLQPDRDRDGLAELRGHGHPRRGHPVRACPASALDLSLWDPATVQNIADVPDLNTWRTIATYADSGGAGLSRGQTDANNFGYTMAATVEGANYTTQVVNGSERPAEHHADLQLHDLVHRRAAGSTPPATTRSPRQEPARRGQEHRLHQHLHDYRNWWHAFWAKSFVQYSNSGR